MQFSLVVLAVLATGGSAAPLKPLSNRAGTCNMNTCVAALAPSFPTACNPAVAQAGANTPFNAACFAAAARSTAAFPPACTQCATQFGVTEPVNKAQEGNVNLPNSNGAPARGANPVATNNQAPGPGSPAAGNGNRPNANGAPPNGVNPAATNNQFPGPGSPAAVGPRPQFGVPDPANNAQGTGNRPNANGAPARGASPVATNNQAPGAGSLAAVGPRASACDIKACVVALEPSFPLCAPAVAQLGANTPFNAACLAAAAKGTAAFPSPCDGCASQFGVTDPGAKTPPLA
ncbi:hypothetical protein C8J57DRAFT_433908 [Mycena rebaudengoi]|nr:hypothetical protein C8J57DRAFT_433908 [Mycena rebaudengoi]